RATLRLASGTLLRLGPNTVLTLSRLQHDRARPSRRKEGIKLKAGRIWASVLSLFGSDSSFEVEGETAVAGVRGTSFFMTNDGENESIVLEEGAVQVRVGEDDYELRRPGESFETSTGVITQVGSKQIGVLQVSTGGSGSQALQQLDAGPESPQPAPTTPILIVRQEINGQDEVVDSGITLDNDSGNQTRDIADVTIRLVPADQ
ncbi:MAG: FecR family protein, partial [Myxococcota bacterium]